MENESAAFVGAAGGVGTTRLTLASGVSLASAGTDVAVLDAAYATQGLADLTSGRLNPDMTALCLEETPLEAGLVDRDIDGAGRLAVCPAHAPFERIARAKTPDAAERFEERIAEAERGFDCVLVDTPPIAANQAVAAVSGVESVVVVCGAERAESAIPRMRDRLVDIGTEASITAVTGADEHPDADVAVPAPGDLPLTASEGNHEGLVSLFEAALGISIEYEEPDGLRSKLSI